MAIEQGTGDDRAIVLIDCGLMFPDPDMHGIDLVLPDFTYLRDHAHQIVALLQHALDGDRAKLVGGQRRKGTVEGADRRARGGSDYDICHGFSSRTGLR